jgi:hypothetical protein
LRYGLETLFSHEGPKILRTADDRKRFWRRRKLMK